MIAVSLTAVFEEVVAERLDEDDVACPRCSADDLAVDVWDVSDEGPEEPRAAAECRCCGARLNVRVTAADIEAARSRARDD